MSKRYGAKINSSQSLSHKKPKLDISVSASNSKYVNKKTIESSRNQNQKVSENVNEGHCSKMLPPVPVKSKTTGIKINNEIVNKNGDFGNELDMNWIDDDDDDEFLIAVSQMAEEKIKNVEYIFSCSQFNNESNLATSTQIPPVQKKNNNVDKLFDLDIPISIFDNESFEIDFEPTPTAIEHAERTNNVETSNLDKPKNDFNNKNENTSFRNILFESNNYKRNQNVPNELINNKSKKDQDTMQVSELVKRLIDLENETKNQTNIIKDQAEKMQNKEGEVSVLRFDIKQLKSQVDVLKIEKIKEAEYMKKHWEDRIEEWKRKYNASQLELNIKSNEIMKIKQNIPQTRTLEIKKCFKLFSSLNLLHMEEFLLQNNEMEMNLETFRNLEKNHDTFLDQFVQQELDLLYISLISLQNNISIIYTNNFIEEIQHSLQRTFDKFFVYFENLRQLEVSENNSIAYDILTKFKNNYLNLIELNFINNNNKIHRTNLNAKKRFQAVQNYMIIFGLICKKVPKISKFLNSSIIQSLQSNEIIQTPINIINHSVDVLIHLNTFECESGLFESYAFLLNCLAKINQVNSENISLLKALLFKHRPSLKTLLYITESLLNIARNSTESLNLLCCKKKTNSCHYNVEKQLLCIQQSSSCCILQVYCTIFELTLINDYDFEDTKLILLLCETFLLFLRQCFTNLPHFIFKSPDLAIKNCKCYYKLSQTFVNFFYTIINRWSNSIVNIPDLIRLKLCKLGSLLVCNFYHQKSDIAQSVTFLSLKHKLYVICEWLDNCRKFLKLNDVTFDKAVNYVRSSFIFANSLDNERKINWQKGVEIKKITFKLI